MSLPAGTGEEARAVSSALRELRGVLAERAEPPEEQREILAQLSDYLIPRYEDPAGPLLVVVGGSTGSGKSTLVNALVREPVAPVSAIRPTTRRPLLLHHPGDGEAAWFASSPPADAEVRALETVPPGLALLDAPDIDSIADDNRRLARRLMDGADAWVFVTTAARYADAVPWTLLREAADRRLLVAVVLDRVPVGASAAVRRDLRDRLSAAGLGRAPLFVVRERETTVAGLLPAEDVSAGLTWLHGLAAEPGSRAAVARQTLGGAVDLMLARLAAAGDDDAELQEALAAVADARRKESGA